MADFSEQINQMLRDLRVASVAMARPLMNGAVPSGLAIHLSVLLLYALVGFYIALALTRRRLLT